MSTPRSLPLLSLPSLLCPLLMHLCHLLHLPAAPVITSVSIDPPTPKAIAKDSSFALNCNAMGVRPPTYSWKFNGEDLDVSKDAAISANNVTGVLEIARATFCHAGTYECLVENRAGNDSEQVEIAVVGK